MRGMRRRILLGLFLILCGTGEKTTVYGASCVTQPMPVICLNSDTEEESGEYLDDLLGQIDFSQLDVFLEEESGRVSFSDLVQGFLEDGAAGFDYSLILEWIADALFYEIGENRVLLLEIVAMAFGFSVLKNFAGAFQTGYVSELCFVLVYCVLSVLLLKSFVNFQGIVEDTLGQSVDFMKTLIPTFCLTMVFSSGTASSAGFYQIAFLVIYLVEWLFVQILSPMIHVYVLLELLNHFFEDEKFRNLSELLRGLICGGMKLAAVAVLGLNVVQGLIAPAKDRLIGGAVTKAASIIPGVGNVLNGVSELIVGAGIVIKNCVGAAALVVLLVLGIVPMVKIACLTFFYKLAAAVTEPVTDKRIAGCLKGMAEGGMLYLRLAWYSMALMLATIALTAAASAFIQ